MEGTSSAVIWRTSSYSGNNGGNCVEVRSAPGSVLVRDTRQHGRGSVLVFTPEVWRRFAASVKSGS